MQGLYFKNTPGMKLHPVVITKGMVLGIALLSSMSVWAQPLPPTGLSATGYDSHIELRWSPSGEPGISGYRIYYSDNGGSSFSHLGIVNAQRDYYIDFIGEQGVTRSYQVAAINNIGQESPPTAPVASATYAMSDDELLTMVQEYTFRYFWEFAHPVSGMARERNTTSIVTSGGSGFGIMAIVVGMERGFITREQGVARLLKIVNFLETADRFKGAFPHWMNGATGDVVPFSQLDDGGDIVETAFLIQGLLAARQYLDEADPDENLVRQKITQIWETVDWNWYRKLTANVMYWHWSPNHNFAMNFALRGFNETHIVYLLAVASPVEVYNIPPGLYQTGWASSNYVNGSSYYGYPLQVGGYRGGPLFFSHYSYLGFDPRGIRDAYTNYFHRNTYHTLINRAHCVANPFNRVGYSESCWGLTASDDPFVGYLAHEPGNSTLDNGTISPTAALSSMPYTPQQSIQALKHFYRDLGHLTWGYYGFYDAFHLGNNWVSNTYLAIDQGPIIVMIENYRTQLLWNNFMANPEIAPALTALGFVTDTSQVVAVEDIRELTHGKIYPNPTTGQSTLELAFGQATTATISLWDVFGRNVLEIAANQKFAAGLHYLPLTLDHLTPGTYRIQIQTDSHSKTLPLVRLNSQ
jgi:hypothetical protein